MNGSTTPSPRRLSPANCEPTSTSFARSSRDQRTSHEESSAENGMDDRSEPTNPEKGPGGSPEKGPGGSRGRRLTARPAVGAKPDAGKCPPPAWRLSTPFPNPECSGSAADRLFQE